MKMGELVAKFLADNGFERWPDRDRDGYLYYWRPGQHVGVSEHGALVFKWSLDGLWSSVSYSELQELVTRD